MRPYREITDDQWRRIAPMLPESRPRKDPRGRPLSNTRDVLNGVLWVLCSESSWASLPRNFPPYQTCHRRFKAWHDEGVLEHIVQHLFGTSSDSVYSHILGRMRAGRERRLQPALTAKQVRAVVPAECTRRYSANEIGEALTLRGK